MAKSHHHHHHNINLLTSKVTPFLGNICVCGEYSGMNLKNSNSSLYHLTEYSLRPSRSNLQLSVTSSWMSTYEGITSSVSLSPSAAAIQRNPCQQLIHRLRHHSRLQSSQKRGVLSAQYTKNGLVNVTNLNFRLVLSNLIENV